MPKTKLKSSKNNQYTRFSHPITYAIIVILLLLVISLFVRGTQPHIAEVSQPVFSGSGCVTNIQSLELSGECQPGSFKNVVFTCNNDVAAKAKDNTQCTPYRELLAYAQSVCGKTCPTSPTPMPSFPTRSPLPTVTPAPTSPTRTPKPPIYIQNEDQSTTDTTTTIVPSPTTSTTTFEAPNQNRGSFISCYRECRLRNNKFFSCVRSCLQLRSR